MVVRFPTRLTWKLVLNILFSVSCFLIVIFLNKTLMYKELPTIYCVTPTYARPVQKAELTRLRQAFKGVQNLHWIIVEDSSTKTEWLSNFLKHCNIPNTHLNISTPKANKVYSHDRKTRETVLRGTLQRNMALAWIREHVTPGSSGVVYFADDDNTYDEELFETMRYTKRVSVWPAGFTGGMMYQGPICQGNKVVGWLARWGLDRIFKADMCAFAFNVDLLFQIPTLQFNMTSRLGRQETNFLSQMTTVEQLEAKSCDKILVWHTQAAPPKLEQDKAYRSENELFRTKFMEV